MCAVQHDVYGHRVHHDMYVHVGMRREMGSEGGYSPYLIVYHSKRIPY